ncbi:MAG: SRPBCC domain-containing protein [Candidatus Acidiferrales bacterium]|jgi:activator of HSP90 ATPase
MAHVIRQTVTLTMPATELYETFLDSQKHTAVTGMPAEVNREVGGSFSAFGGQIRGKTLAFVPNRMIVQAWRASHWKNEDPDSILILIFSKAKAGGTIDLTHVNVPKYDRKGVTNGWPSYYWNPWKAYLAKKK